MLLVHTGMVFVPCSYLLVTLIALGTYFLEQLIGKKGRIERKMLARMAGTTISCLVR